MTRLSGIQILALSFVLWALAVWSLSTPDPAETQAPAAIETPPHRTSGEQVAEAGTDTGEPTVAEVATAPVPATDQGAAVASSPDPSAGDSTRQGASAHVGVGATAAAPSTARVPATPPAEVRPPPGAVAGSSGLAPTPIPTPTPTPESARGDLAIGAARGSPMIPGDAVAGIPPGGGAGKADLPPDSARPYSWFEYPPSRPPPPVRSDLSARHGDAVAGQLAAARRAVWEARLTDALSHYRAAARLRQDDYVVWGEMGNVLWKMGRWSEAAYALEGAATLLVRSGELRAASELASEVSRIDLDAAYRIQQLLWDVAQRQPG